MIPRKYFITISVFLFMQYIRLRNQQLRLPIYVYSQRNVLLLRRCESEKVKRNEEIKHECFSLSYPNDFAMLLLICCMLHCTLTCIYNAYHLCLVEIRMFVEFVHRAHGISGLKAGCCRFGADQKHLIENKMSNDQKGNLVI